MRFSLIVPVYNVEKYIGRCMDSLVNQTFRDYEIILVDDESPDSSMAIVETYREKDPERIHVVHQKNTRQGGARNHGVRLSGGEYLLFIDSDDYVAENMLEVADRRLREHPCDILAFDHIPVDEMGRELPPEIGAEFPSGVYDPYENTNLVQMHVAPWGKAYRKEFYVNSGFQFPEKLLYEDGVTRILYAKAKSLYITEDRLYYYVHRENSSMTRKVTEKNLDILKMADMVLGEFKNAGLYDHFKEPLQITLIYSILCILEMISDTDQESPLQKPIAAYLQKNFPDYRENSLIDPELCRVLDCVIAGDFKKYHWRFLKLSRLKEDLLRNPFLAKLNELRKKC